PGDLEPDFLKAVVDVGPSQPAGHGKTPEQLVVNAVELVPDRAQQRVGGLTPHLAAQELLRQPEQLDIGARAALCHNRISFWRNRRMMIARLLRTESYSVVAERTTSFEGSGERCAADFRVWSTTRPGRPKRAGSLADLLHQLADRGG